MAVAKDAWTIDHNRLENSGPIGAAAWKNGAVLINRQGLRDIGMLDRSGRLSSFVAAYDGKKLNSPNDLTVARDGAVWFTDPPFAVPGFFRPNGQAPDKPIPFSGVYRVKDGKMTAMVTDMAVPNGIVFSPNGKTLYVSGSRPAAVRAFDVGPGGTLSNSRTLIEFAPDTPFGRGQPDGMKVDVHGNIWLIGSGGLLVIDPSGKLLGRAQMPKVTANISFGGDDFSSVYISTSGDRVNFLGDTVYRLQTLVKGQVPMYAQR